MSWYVLNYVPASYHQRKTMERNIALLFPDPEDRIEIFAPEFVQVVERHGNPRRIVRPLLYHYVFAKGNADSIKTLCSTLPGFSYVIDRSGKQRHLQLSDDTVKAFQTVARLFGNRLPCFDTDNLALEEGDKVQVVTGDFSGLTGTYISRKGGKSGNILIAVEGTLSVVVFDIKAEYVRVLEFARNTKRVYDQVDAFVPKLLAAIKSFKEARVIKPSEATPLQIFCRRFGTVKLDNHKLAAKVKALLASAFTLLGETDEATKALESYRRRKTAVTNVKTQSLINEALSIIENQ